MNYDILDEDMEERRSRQSSLLPGEEFAVVVPSPGKSGRDTLSDYISYPDVDDTTIVSRKRRKVDSPLAHHRTSLIHPVDVNSDDLAFLAGAREIKLPPPEERSRPAKAKAKKQSRLGFKKDDSNRSSATPQPKQRSRRQTSMTEFAKVGIKTEESADELMPKMQISALERDRRTSTSEASTGVKVKKEVDACDWMELSKKMEQKLRGWDADKLPGANNGYQNRTAQTSNPSQHPSTLPPNPANPFSTRNTAVSTSSMPFKSPVVARYTLAEEPLFYYDENTPEHNSPMDFTVEPTTPLNFTSYDEPKPSSPAGMFIDDDSDEPAPSLKGKSKVVSFSDEKESNPTQEPSQAQKPDIRSPTSPSKVQAPKAIPGVPKNKPWNVSQMRRANKSTTEPPPNMANLQLFAPALSSRNAAPVAALDLNVEDDGDSVLNFRMPRASVPVVPTRTGASAVQMEVGALDNEDNTLISKAPRASEPVVPTQTGVSAAQMVVGMSNYSDKAFSPIAKPNSRKGKAPTSGPAKKRGKSLPEFDLDFLMSEALDEHISKLPPISKSPKASAPPGSVIVPKRKPKPSGHFTAPDPEFAMSDSDDMARTDLSPTIPRRRLVKKPVAAAESSSDDEVRLDLKPTLRATRRLVKRSTNSISEPASRPTLAHRIGLPSTPTKEDRKTALQALSEKRLRKQNRTKRPEFDTPSASDDGSVEEVVEKWQRPRGRLDVSDDDFVVSDDEDQADFELPTEFSRRSHMDTKDAFCMAVQWTFFALLDTAFNAEDERFQPAMRSLERKIDAFRNSVFESSLWMKSFKAAMARPKMVEWPETEQGRRCDACRRIQQSTDHIAQFRGQFYDPITLQDLSESDQEMSEDSNGNAPLEEHEFHLGAACFKKTQLAHRFRHWRKNLYQNIKKWLDENHLLDDEAILERVKMRSEKRNQYVNNVLANYEGDGKLDRMYTMFNRDLSMAEKWRTSRSEKR